ncbi:MAG TPA: Nif3-like dinuclear metal center hexameric protein [Phycisphaerales bacterium]|nr:Nif3-like dinuclear metal center hexameric protein [Phycisphaerales bacterium]HMP36178.1 Nif3-like dinuclear metal center hexameric protein [Phycisphaerales bacterium]
MPTVGDICAAIESFAPASFAEEWDNVGLLVGSTSWAAERILLTIDLTDAVLAEAIAQRVGLVIAYHPLIFKPIVRVTDSAGKGRIVLGAARAGIAVHSPHTALDASAGGINDWLAEGLGTGDVRALTPHEALPKSEECKLVTYCPVDAVDRVRRALSTVGAGKIGNYELCSFEIHGEGTFLGNEESSPALGRRGVLERVREVRLEMVCPRDALGLAVTTLRQFHPYEEPPLEIHQLRPRPQRTIGLGRRLTLDRPAPLAELVERIKGHLGIPAVVVAEGGGAGGGAVGPIGIVGICAGSGGSLLDEALAQGCQLFYTGEMGHHDVLKAQERGCSVVLAGHTNTERGFLPRLRDRLAERCPGVEILISREDREPLAVR